MIAVVLAVWVLGGAVLAVVVGAAVRIADARDDQPVTVDDVVPAPLAG